MPNTNEYMRKYMLNRYHERRNKAIKDKGGKCQICGSKKYLEFDHKDKNKKGFDIAKAFAGFSQERLSDELSECQLLCRACHYNKTLEDSGKKNARLTHGTISSYRYCKCEKCKEAKMVYTNNRRKKLREGR